MYDIVTSHPDLSEENCERFFPFFKGNVDQLSDPDFFDMFGNSSPYIQLRTDFSELGELLDSFDIEGQKALLFGGYTGQFAEALRTNGYDVVFTDMLSEWVENAREKGFESYKHIADEIPFELQEGVDFYTTFECYGPLFSSVKMIMESVGRKNDGLIFIENSESVFKSEFDNHEKLMLSLERFAEHYSFRCVEEKKGDLYGIHLYGNEDERKVLSEDLIIVRLAEFLNQKRESDLINPDAMSALLCEVNPDFTPDRVYEGSLRYINASENV